MHTGSKACISLEMQTSKKIKNLTSNLCLRYFKEAVTMLTAGQNDQTQCGQAQKYIWLQIFTVIQ